MLLAVGFVVFFALLYFVVRKAVAGGILDAEVMRRERELRAQFEQTLRSGNVDAPAE